MRRNGRTMKFESKGVSARGEMVEVEMDLGRYRKGELGGGKVSQNLRCMNTMLFYVY